MTFAEQERETLPTVPSQLEKEDPAVVYFSLCCAVWVLIAIFGSIDVVFVFLLLNIRRGRSSEINIPKIYDDDIDLDDYDLDDFDDDDEDLDEFDHDDRNEEEEEEHHHDYPERDFVDFFNFHEH